MKKKLFYLVLTVLFVLSYSTSALAKPASPEEIHFNTIITDGHSDTMSHVVDSSTWLPKVDIGKDTPFEVDIPKLQAGGVNVPFFAAYTSGYYNNTPRSISRTLALINALYWTEKNNPDTFKISSSLKEIEKTVHAGKIAAVPTIEGAYSMDEENAIELLHQYRDLGVTSIGFNWNYSNALGEGANRQYNDPNRTPSEGGLTELGANVAREMNRLGMVIDVSHMAEGTFWDVIQVSDAPIIASHSGVKALKDHQRNLSDDQLKALKENGGVINIVFYPAFLTNKPNTYIADVVDHIDHVVNLIGIDHVGLGSDYDGATLPEDLPDVSHLPKLTEELVNRGYTKQDIEKILGKNMLRVLKEVEKAADHDPANVGTGLTITPTYEMGEIIQDRTPVLTAKVAADNGAKVDENSFRVIVDGISYTPAFDNETSTISLELDEGLKERFHVVTFEAANNAGKVTRETRIFYIND
ncbi:dipeptidase [Bacillus freudenreichii]|nr:dipeptidase [Bacillus freudenreichii]